MQSSLTLSASVPQPSCHRLTPRVFALFFLHHPCVSANTSRYPQPESHYAIIIRWPPVRVAAGNDSCQSVLAYQPESASDNGSILPPHLVAVLPLLCELALPGLGKCPESGIRGPVRRQLLLSPGPARAPAFFAPIFAKQGLIWPHLRFVPVPVR